MDRENGHSSSELKKSAPGPAVAHPAKGLDVLIVEDDADSAESMAAILRHHGHQPTIVPDGAGALQAAQVRLPDVVLLDIGLPDLDGFGVAKWIAERPCDKRPLLIAVTGLAQEEDRRRSREAGIDLHLVKPVDPDSLLGLLNRFLAIIK
jgi:DNA-binding response OmpR family regulator